MPRGVQRVEMRQELIAAAAAIIDEGGVDALTVRALSTRAGCASGVLYNYFRERCSATQSTRLAPSSPTPAPDPSPTSSSNSPGLLSVPATFASLPRR